MKNSFSLAVAPGCRDFTYTDGQDVGEKVFVARLLLLLAVWEEIVSDLMRVISCALFVCEHPVEEGTITSEDLVVQGGGTVFTWLQGHAKPAPLLK